MFRSIAATFGTLPIFGTGVVDADAGNLSLDRYYRGAQAAVVVYDVSNYVCVREKLHHGERFRIANISLSLHGCLHV
jgi:hypothetical protein